MEWTPIVSEAKDSLYINRLDDIARIMCDNSWENSCGLMYGKMGSLLFLFNDCEWKGDEKTYLRAVELLSHIIKQTKNAVNNGFIINDCSLETGQSGINWGIAYFVNNEFLDADLTDILGYGDAPVFRHMIEMVQEPELTHLDKAVGIGLYAVNRGSRLSQEFLRRFVNELFVRIKEPKIERKIFSQKSAILAGTIRLLNKISKRYPDIDRSSESLIFLLELCASKPETEYDFQTLLVMIEKNSNREQALNELNCRARRILENINMLNVDSGLERGLVATAHCFNRIFQQTGSSLYKDVSTACFDRLLDTAIFKDEFSKVLWHTSSRGLWCQHYGLLNGLAGIGLTLLGAISDTESTWDEVIYLS